MINDLYEKETFMYESKILKISIVQLGKIGLIAVVSQLVSANIIIERKMEMYRRYIFKY